MQESFYGHFSCLLLKVVGWILNREIAVMEKMIFSVTVALYALIAAGMFQVITLTFSLLFQNSR